jgi:hypothetical protein
MFENLPEKIKKLYQEKIKEEEASKQKQTSDPMGSDEGKWKMKFSKDERQSDTKKSQAMKNFSLYESDEEDSTRNFQAQAPTQLLSTNYSAPSTSSASIEKRKSPVKPEVPATVNVIPKGTVVLDKFGNFRLADPQPVIQKPADTSTRRSRSRSRRSRSRSDSR